MVQGSRMSAVVRKIRAQQPGVRRGKREARPMVKRYSLGPVLLILEFIRRSLGVVSTIQLQVMPPRAATREPAGCNGCAQAHRSPSVLAAVRFQALRCRGPPAEQPTRFV